MIASQNGHLKVVQTLLRSKKAIANRPNKVIYESTFCMYLYFAYFAYQELSKLHKTSGEFLLLMSTNVAKS
jgi:hypothetical protein